MTMASRHFIFIGTPMGGGALPREWDDTWYMSLGLSYGWQMG